MRPPVPPGHRKNTSSHALTMIIAFVLIMCLALTMGYLVTKHIIYPFILKQDLSKTEDSPTAGGIVVDENEIPKSSSQGADDIVTGGKDADETALADNNTPSAVISPPQEQNTPASASNPQVNAPVYSVQLANLSTKAAADEMTADFNSRGITCSVKEVNGSFKILCGSYATKDEARSHLPAISTAVPDAFVTTLSQ